MQDEDNAYISNIRFPSTRTQDSDFLERLDKCIHPIHEICIIDITDGDCTKVFYLQTSLYNDSTFYKHLNHKIIVNVYVSLVIK